MQKLAISAALLLIVACTEEPNAPESPRPGNRSVPDGQQVLAATGAQRDTYRRDIPFDWLLTPGEFPCLTEPIHAFGIIEEHLVFVDSPGSIHLTVHQSTRIEAVGVVTGDAYQFSGPLTYTASGSTAVGGPHEWTFHNINHLVGPGADSNIFFRTLVHVTRDETGAITVAVVRDEVLCH